MIEYVAFLRGINVGGKKVIKMEDLTGVFVALGFKNVRTFIQSGNVIFDAAEASSQVLVGKIEKKLLKSLGHEVTVILRTIDHLKDIVRRNPFKKIEPAADVVMFVTFLSDEPNRKLKLPLTFAKENLEVFDIRDCNAFILSRRKQNGWFGFPNNFIEKELGVPAITRNSCIPGVADLNSKVPSP